MAATVEPHPRPLGPIPRRVPFERTRAWRVLSFLFGVVAPALIWGSIGLHEFGLRPGSAGEHSLLHGLVWRGSMLVAFVEIVCLALWLAGDPRPGRAQRVFSIVFRIGALLAAGWSVFCLLGLLALLRKSERSLLMNIAVGLVLLSPLVCVFVYSVNARVAWSLRRLRTSPESVDRTGWGSEAQDRAPE